MTGVDVIPERAEDLDAHVVSRALGERVEVIAVERIGAAFGFAGVIYRLRLGDWSVGDSAVAKLWPAEGAGDLTELRFHDRLAARCATRLPSVLFGAADLEVGRAWMVVEDLTPCRQGDELVDEPPTVVGALVDSLAVVHAAWWHRLADHRWLRSAPISRSQGWMVTRRREFEERFGVPDDPLVRRVYEALPELSAAAGRTLRAAPETVLHCDLTWDNVLFSEPSGAPILIDWANCSRGAGVVDLAATVFALLEPLTGGSIHELFDRYLAGLAHGGITDVDRRSAMAWFHAAMVVGFTTCTLGTARWSAMSGRGPALLARRHDRLPAVVSAWREFDPAGFDDLRLA